MQSLLRSKADSISKGVVVFLVVQLCGQLDPVHHVLDAQHSGDLGLGVDGRSDVEHCVSELEAQSGG